jgi:ABC-type antimicrobial peptide transport system permease subunit
MLKHYIKVAFRNLWKYKSQTLISIVGLAVGFACFAMATLWIRHEMTYDSFHKNADRMYCIYIPNVFNPNGISRSAPYFLAGYLKKTFPEISNAIAVTPVSNAKIEIDDIELPADLLQIDSSFSSMFNVNIIEGNRDFLIQDSKKIAITREKSMQLFGHNEKPIGKTIMSNNVEYVICAVVTDLPKHSNYPYDFLFPILQNNDWKKNILIELKPGINVEVFKTKLYGHEINSEIKEMTIIPLTTMRYEARDIETEVKFQHLVIFALTGFLVILCTLFNYLALFVSRFRMRQKELTLRTIFGASGRSLFALLSVEFIMTLIMALLSGIMVTQTVDESFIALSGIKSGLSSIYSELLIYMGVITAIILLTVFILIIILRRKYLNTAIRRSNKKLFRKMSVVVQLIISIGFAFCTTIIVKQMYYLHNTDLGFAFKNRGSLRISRVNAGVLENQLNQIPEITETLNAFQILMPVQVRASNPVYNWTDKPEGAKEINIENIEMSAKYESYYELQLLEGEMLNDVEPGNNILINEAAAKAFGWTQSAGKSFDGFNVKGVIKNIYNFAPTVSAKPIFYTRGNMKGTILFKYKEGTWKTCKHKIENLIKKEYPNPNINRVYLYNTEDEYDKYLKSENTLLKILTFVSLVCVVICLFGFVSIVSLTCEERRKEIAIRKINGATVKDILDIFFKEYLVLLAVGALIAFLVGYIIMQRWLEQYVLQTEISAWILIAIMLVLMLAIIFCVGGKVCKTSRTNPIDALKSE